MIPLRWLGILDNGKTVKMVLIEMLALEKPKDASTCTAGTLEFL